jgi:CRISPR/Cas system CSM-associated protein Csm3 (group 7 of RAMP superfamily)
MPREQFQLTLQEPFTCSANPVVSNEIHTLDHIPATLLRGAIYTALVREGRTPGVEDYLGVGLGKPRYSPAWPVSEGMMAVAMPLSFLNDKGDKGLGGEYGCVNSLWFEDSGLPEKAGEHKLQWTRPGQRWLICDAAGKPSRSYTIETTSEMHVGLHYGRQANRKSALFSQSVIGSETEFRFLVDWPEGRRQALPEELYLGKRRSTGNGAARVEARPTTPFPKEGSPPKGELLIEFISDCLVPSAEGGWEMGMGAEAWRRLLGTPVEVLAAKSAYRQVFGWSGVWGRPRESAVAVAAGSVFRLRPTDFEKAAEKLGVLEQSGLGARVEEGFGWIAVNPVWLFAGRDKQAFGKAAAGGVTEGKEDGQRPLCWPGLEGVADAKRLVLVDMARSANKVQFGRKLAELASLAGRSKKVDEVWRYLEQMAGRDRPHDWDNMSQHLAATRKANLGINELRFVLNAAAVLSRSREGQSMREQMSDVSYRPYRLEIRGRLKPSTAFHVGSGQSFHTVSDGPLLRGGNHPDGAPYLPGSSLRGVIRAHLEREAPLLGCRMADIETLFGASSETSSHYGRLQVRDALGKAQDAEIRDHVRINEKWGAADYGAKFDLETGTANEFAFEAIYEGDGEKDSELVLVREAVRFLQSEGFRVGAKAAWGLGRMQLGKDLEILEFQRKTDEGLLGYLNWRVCGEKPASAALPGLGEERAVQAAAHAWNAVTLDLELQFEGPVLVKSAIPKQGGANSIDPRDPSQYWKKALANADGTFVTTVALGEDYYLPGSSLRGVLRHEALWIAGQDKNRLRQVDALFGFAKGSAAGEAGRLMVEDGRLGSAANVIPLDHVAIDRIVAGAADGKKFDTAGLESPRFNTRITLQFEKKNKLLLQWLRALVRQMEGGRLWAGSGTARGYGLLKTVSVKKAVADLTDELALPLAGDDVTKEKRPGRTLYTMAGAKQLEHLWKSL